MRPCTASGTARPGRFGWRTRDVLFPTLKRSPNRSALSRRRRFPSARREPRLGADLFDVGAKPLQALSLTPSPTRTASRPVGCSALGGRASFFPEGPKPPLASLRVPFEVDSVQLLHHRGSGMPSIRDRRNPPAAALGAERAGGLEVPGTVRAVPPAPRDTGWAMSQENVEVVRRADRHFAQTGELLWEVMHPDVISVDWDVPDSHDRVGHQGLRKWLENWASAWEPLRDGP